MNRNPDVMIEIIQGETFHLELLLKDEDGNVQAIDALATTAVESENSALPATDFTATLTIAEGRIEVISNSTSGWPEGTFFIDVRLLQSAVPKEANKVITRVQISVAEDLT